MVEDGKAPKRMGRPRKAPEKGKRQNYTFRMSDKTRDVIVREAEAAGRSMSEEIELRIEGSITQKERIKFVIDTARYGDRTIMSVIIKACGGLDTILFAGIFARDIKTAVKLAESNGDSSNIWFENEESINFVTDEVVKRVPGIIKRYAESVSSGTVDIFPEDIANLENERPSPPMIPEGL